MKSVIYLGVMALFSMVATSAFAERVAPEGKTTDIFSKKQRRHIV